MEIKILEKTKNTLRLEVAGEGHTLCNALRRQLWEDKTVEVAGYNNFTEYYDASNYRILYTYNSFQYSKIMLCDIENI